MSSKRAQSTSGSPRLSTPRQHAQAEQHAPPCRSDVTIVWEAQLRTRVLAGGEMSQKHSDSGLGS